MSSNTPVSGQEVAAMVGAIAGLVFILVNAGPLPDSIAAAVGGLGVRLITCTLPHRRDSAQGR